MKIFTTFLFITLLSFPLCAKSETLLGGPVDHGGYGGPFVKMGEIYGDNGIFIGGQGGWIINHTFVIGGKGYGLVNELEIEGSPDQKLEFGCGGLFLEYIINSDKLTHFTVHALIGGGGVRYVDKDYEEDNHDFNGDGFFIAEPGINLMLNVTDFFRIGAGVTYRYVSGVDYKELSNSDLSGASAQIVFKFGSF